MFPSAAFATASPPFTGCFFDFSSCASPDGLPTSRFAFLPWQRCMHALPTMVPIAKMMSRGVTTSDKKMSEAIEFCIGRTSSPSAREYSS
eukprot:scaffold15577_cov35-Tisochrysis_lutea.AAC.5